MALWHYDPNRSPCLHWHNRDSNLGVVVKEKTQQPQRWLESTERMLPHGQDPLRNLSLAGIQGPLRIVFRLAAYVRRSLSGWYAKPSGKRGAPRRYSHIATRFALTLKVLFNLPLRGSEGFAEDALRLLGLDRWRFRLSVNTAWRWLRFALLCAGGQRGDLRP